MKKRKILNILTTCMICCGVNLSLQAKTDISYDELAHDVTALVRAFRQTIVVNPDSIHKTNEYFQEPAARLTRLTGQAKVFFKAMAQKDYPVDDASESGKIRMALENAFEKVILDVAAGKHDLKWKGKNEYVKKWDGKLLPARFAALVAEEFNVLTDGRVSIKLTTSKQLVVNESNAPDDWESEVIETALLNTNKNTGKPQSLDSPTEFRYMLPEFYAPACIQCHGTNAGQEGFDIHPSKLARSVGSFAGAISIRIRK